MSTTSAATINLLDLGQELALLLGPAWACETWRGAPVLREKANTGIDLAVTLNESGGRIVARSLLPDPGWYSFANGAESPAITFDARRPARVLAADIQTRLLPPARLFLSRVVEAKALHDESERLKAANTAALCRASGGWLKPAEDGDTLSAYLPDSLQVSARVQPNDVRLLLNWLPPSLAERIVALVAEHVAQPAGPAPYYLTTVTVEVVTRDRPYGLETLSDLAYDIADGDCSGQARVTKVRPLTGPEAAAALKAQGSDPEFLGLTEDGQPLDRE